MRATLRRGFAADYFREYLVTVGGREVGAVYGERFATPHRPTSWALFRFTDGLPVELVATYTRLDEAREYALRDLGLEP